jgi:hypothetical protein
MAYRAYVANLVQLKEAPNVAASWDPVLREFDAENRDMIKSGELTGFGDPRIMQRFWSGGKWIQRNNKSPKGPKSPKNPRDTSKIPCDFHKKPGGCKKGADCDFKH